MDQELKKAVVVANFGGPRSLEEIEAFLITLLTDKDVIRTPLPNFIQDWFFRRVARKRAKSLAHDYALIGGKSPIYDDTEAVARLLECKCPVLTFHRYVPATHAQFIEQAKEFDEITVFSMFPQFSYATTGSIARWFGKYLPAKNIRWVKSYAIHPAFISCFHGQISRFLLDQRLEEEETLLFFSPHGLPRSFIDGYQGECEKSFRLISSAFPKALSKLAYQSKFGRGEWLRPYTNEACEEILSFSEGRKNIVFVPLSFTSDHIETLFEVEQLYLPIVRQKGLNAYRVPAFNRGETWIKAIQEILDSPKLYANKELIRSH